MNSFFFDTNYETILKRTKVTKIALKEVNKKALIKLNEEDILNVLNLLKPSRVRVGFLDFKRVYKLSDDLELGEIVDITKKFVCNHVFLNIPTFNDFEEEKVLLVEKLDEIIKFFKREKIKVSFHLDYQINSAITAYLITKIKELNFIFDSAKCFKHQKSISTYYRLIKERINVLIVNDLTNKNEPTLLLQGKGQIKEMSERLKFENYKGDVIYDFNLLDYLENRKKIYKKRFPLFKGKSFDNYLAIEERLGLTKESDLAYENLFINQFNLLDHLFK